MRLVQRSDKIQRVGLAVVVELFQDVAKKELPRAEGGQSRIVADLVGEIDPLCAKTVNEGQHPAVQSQRGRLQLTPAGQLLGLADEEAEHARRAEHRGAARAFPAEILDIEGFVQPRLDLGRIELGVHLELHLPFTFQPPRGPTHRLSMVFRQPFLIEAPNAVDFHAADAVAFMVVGGEIGPLARPEQRLPARGLGHRVVEPQQLPGELGGRRQKHVHRGIRLGRRVAQQLAAGRPSVAGLSARGNQPSESV